MNKAFVFLICFLTFWGYRPFQDEHSDTKAVLYTPINRSGVIAHNTLPQFVTVGANQIAYRKFGKTSATPP